MKPYRKTFYGDPLFPLELTYKMTRKTKNELPNHLHDRYELVYVHGGNGTFFIDQTWYEKKAGDLFFIPGNTIHHSMPENDNPIVSSALYFAPALLAGKALDEHYSHLMCFELANKSKAYQLALPEPLRQTVELVLTRIASELTKQDLGYRESVRLLLSAMLLELNRHMLRNMRAPGSDTTVGPSWIRDALRLIDEYPESIKSIAHLAINANVSPSHFSRVFKQLTEMNAIDYLNAKRIIRAKDLLLLRDDTVSVVAEQCGFDNPAHFYRVFKNLTGTTPYAYRKHQSANSSEGE